MKKTFAILLLCLVATSGIVYLNRDEKNENKSENMDVHGYIEKNKDEILKQGRSGSVKPMGGWAVRKEMPTARYGLAIGVVNNKIYAIGGKGDDGGYVNVTEEYDTVNDTWTTKASMSTTREILAIGVVKNKIYAIGGWDGSNILSTNEEYDPANNIWTTKASMPTARYWLAIGVVNNKIYAIGGWDSESANEEYDPSPPDLTISSLPPSNVYVNTTVTFNATIKNIGYGTATANYLNVSFSIGSNSTVSVQNINIPVSDEITVSAPANWLAPKTTGTHTLTISFYTDVGGGTPGQYPMIEESYANHSMSFPITVYVSDDYDTDSDGMPDAWEYNYSLDLWNSNDANLDPDKDNLTNIGEFKNNANPQIPDTDGDGIPDGWEVSNGFAPLNATDASGDADNDGLNNLNEYINSTAPRNSDTDGDGMPDGWEVKYNLNPLNASDASLDIEIPFNDGLTNLQEYLNSTDPYKWDTDGDALGDGFELIFSETNPTLGDSNGNGIGDGLEFIQDYGYQGQVSTLPSGWLGMQISWKNYTILLATNSTTLKGSFDVIHQKLTVKISGEKGSKGAAMIIAPKALVKGPKDIEIKIDNNPLDFTLYQNETHVFVNITYTHSTRELSATFMHGMKEEERKPLTGPQKPILYDYIIAGIGGAGAIVVLILMLSRMKKKKKQIEDKEAEKKAGKEEKK